MPSMARDASRLRLRSLSGASVATTTMIEPSGPFTGASLESPDLPRMRPTGTPRMVSSDAPPKFDCTSTPTVRVLSPAFTTRDDAAFLHRPRGGRGERVPHVSLGDEA